jgi:hypothetical protein
VTGVILIMLGVAIVAVGCYVLGYIDGRGSVR